MQLRTWLEECWYQVQADYPLRIEQMSKEQIRELEERMRPGNRTEKGSREGFLSETDSLQEIIVQDAATLQGIGIEHKDLAYQLKIQLAKEQNKIGSLGKQYCPWGVGRMRVEAHT